MISKLSMIVIGLIGFGILGYVQAHLSNGKKFSEQTSGLKKVIICVSMAQWPYLVLAIIGALKLMEAI